MQVNLLILKVIIILLLLLIIFEITRYYAQAIRASNIEFDVIFGPAYKGIPLASGIATAWYELYNEDKSFAYNRKEAKDHGEVFHYCCSQEENNINYNIFF